jgi:hypothetical protein
MLLLIISKCNIKNKLIYKKIIKCEKRSLGTANCDIQKVLTCEEPVQEIEYVYGSLDYNISLQ